MQLRRFVPLFGAICLAAHGQVLGPDVGSGAPTETIRQQFQSAFYRNGFANLVAQPPIADVRRFGANGLIQEYADVKNATIRFALVMPNQATPVVEGRTVVFQVHGGMFAYFTSVGVNTAGMPTSDTINCPALVLANTCKYQTFDKNYALFVYTNLVNLTGTTFATRDPYYTKWIGYGGIAVLGPASSAEAAVTSSSAATATVQQFDRGAIYSFITGNLAGKQIGVKQPIWDVYAANSAHFGALGFPTSEELVATNGRLRQTFENGSVEYDRATGSTFFRPAAAFITINGPASPIRLKLGESVTLKALVADSAGNSLTDRDILWQTSDSRVASIQPAGATVVVKASGGGSATIRVTTEGKTSTPVTISVSAPCCGVGEGAPTLAVSKAFQDALSRNQLSVKLPSAALVTRVGSGYIQQFEVDGTGRTLIVAVPDRLGSGFVLQNRVLTRYLELGGPTGLLGYPISDATAAGRQLFEKGALAGDPVQLVTGDILEKWGLLGFETGVAGSPTSAPAAFLTFRATRGEAQPFRGATLVAIARELAGAPARGYAIGGLILSAYLAAGGPTGRIGAPTSDEYSLNGRRKQDFEGGSLGYAPGDTTAALIETPRQPVVTAAPSTVLTGGRLRLAIGGFDEDATVRVSISGQPDFLVRVPSGAYLWETLVPANSRSGAVTVRAVDAANQAKSAQGGYTVRALSEARLTLQILRGDSQTGVPGALLPAPLTVTLRDEAGNPVPNVAIQFSASPGASIEPAAGVTPGAGVTNENGEAEAMLRLPAGEGLTLATARAASQVVTFNARAASASLSNFPEVTQAVAGAIGDSAELIARKGSMLASVAAIVRYHQSRGELPLAPAGVDAPLLNDFLRTFCIASTSGAPTCDGYLKFGDSDPVVNLWRLSSFAGPLGVTVEATDVANLRDRVAQGAPVLLGLALSAAGAPLGSHFVVATGVGSNGDIFIMDPNPALNRATLGEYLAGFATEAGTIRATVAAAARLVPGQGQAAFLAAVNGAVDLNSQSGACGVTFEFPATGAVLSVAAPSLPPVRLRACNGAVDGIYQLDVSGPAYRGTFRDLGVLASVADLGGGGAASFKVSRRDGVWSIGPIEITVSANGVVNAASFTRDIAPGGIAAIFGAGFGRPGTVPSVLVNGVEAPVLASFPFQINVAIPQGISEGPATLRIESAFGSTTLPAELRAVAPAIFLVGQRRGAVINRNGALNAPDNPAVRGEVIVAYATGFGQVSPKGNLMIADVPVTAWLSGNELPVSFAGLTPGFVGLYQVNVTIPVGTAPGVAQPFSIRQANSTSNTVEIAIQ